MVYPRAIAMKTSKYHKLITGRGGSDTSASCYHRLAAIYKQEEMFNNYTDEMAVYTTDPELTPEAR